MTYKIEFPDYDDILSFPEGWIDDSWHNDVCPKFIKDKILIWCDYKEFDRRETEGQQFIVSLDHEDGCEPLQAFNSLSDALAFAQTQFTQPSQINIHPEDVDLLAWDALNAACSNIQDAIKQPNGDVAGVFFSGEKGEQILSILQEYIRLELSFRKE